MTDPIKDVHVEFPKEEDGSDNKYVAIVTAGKPVSEVGQPGKLGEQLMYAIYSCDGVEGGKLLGRYTVSIQIARTFDADEVLDDVCAVVKRHSSAIIQSVGAGEISMP